MKMLKKALSLSLAFALSLALAVPTLAAEAQLTVYWLPEGMQAQSSSIQEDLLRVEKDGKYGFVNLIGQIVIPLEYDRAGDFSEGLVAVEKDGKCGFIDPTGQIVIPLEYEGLGEFSEGLAQAKRGGLYGYIDRDNNAVIPFLYEMAGNFSEGLAAVSQNEKWGYIDKTGQVVIPLELDYSWPGEFEHGLAAVSGDHGVGFIDKTGQFVVPIKYGQFNGFSEGMGLVRRETAPGEYHYCYINTSGEEVIPPLEGSLGHFYEGLAYISRDGKDGFIDRTGQIAIPLEYDDANGFSEGLAPVKKDGKWGFIDRTGQVVVPLELEYRDVSSLSRGLAFVRTEDYMFGLIDNNGQVVVPTEYDGMLSKYAPSSGPWAVALVNKGGRMGFLHIYRTATPTNDRLMVNGVERTPTVYKINGANYFKIRDLAALLDGTSCQFSVDYDAVSNSVTAATGQGYTRLDTDLAGAPSGNQTALVSNDTILVNGKAAQVEVYKIDGSNYFKLRDLGDALGFEVGWDPENNIASINTKG